ncbi:hypothetical protein C7S15_8360 [Burkholderia cepacia]|nr:hypothetical protein [Burkholderia cepacia]
MSNGLALTHFVSLFMLWCSRVRRLEGDPECLVHVKRGSCNEPFILICIPDQ